MQENLDNRINEILESTKGSQRAKPNINLLAKIEKQIYQEEATLIPLSRLRLVAAAAALLLFVNGLAVNVYLKQEMSTTEYTETFITDYKLYE